VAAGAVAKPSASATSCCPTHALGVVLTRAAVGQLSGVTMNITLPHQLEPRFLGVVIARLVPAPGGQRGLHDKLLSQTAHGALSREKTPAGLFARSLPQVPDHGLTHRCASQRLNIST